MKKEGEMAPVRKDMPGSSDTRYLLVFGEDMMMVT